VSTFPEEQRPRGSGPLVKIAFPLKPSSEDPTWPPVSVEKLWAERVGDNQYRLDNIPWFASGVSYNDIVSVEDPEADEPLKFKRLITPRGHSTYRVRTDFEGAEKHGIFHQLLDALQKLKCSVENNSAGFFSIDVPPGASVHGVYDLLSKGEEWGVWDFEEGAARV